MYAASAQYINAIKADTVELGWNGTINTVGGNTYTFTKDDIAPGNGSIVRTISTQSLKIGTVFAASLNLELILPGVSRYELYGAKVTISNSVVGASDVIPMGEYTINKATQSADHINIVASDNMIKFADVNFTAKDNNNIQSPYGWVLQACTECGVVLGSTSADISMLPNGNRNTGFADCVTDVKTWRDVLSYMAAYLGAFCLIGRDGKLYLKQYAAASSDTVGKLLRYSSGLSDYRTTYNGLYAIYKNDGVQEYVSNSNVDGLVLDLGTNPFLQFNDQGNRLAALQEIIDSWDGIYYVPYQCEMGIIPIYDPGDVITFTDNQAESYDYGSITQITYRFDGGMTIVCTGDNPLLASAQDRFSKTLAGLSAEYNNGQEVGGKDFWILHTTNTGSVIVGSTEVQIAEIEYNQKTFGQEIEMVLTVDSVLSATAEVNIRLTVDDDTDLETNVTESKSMLGERVFHCSNPQNVLGEGNHIVKAYMTVTDSPLLWSDIK